MGHRDRKPRPKQSKYITPEGYERYRRELEHLWTSERPKVTQGVAEAAAEGDRSENAEYIYGKKRLREIDRRIRFLEKRLDETEIVHGVGQSRRDPSKVYFGAWVRVEDEAGEQAVYRVVGPDDHDLAPEYVSMDAPLGRALLGKRVDDEIVVRRPRGELRVEILEVAYAPLEQP